MAIIKPSTAFKQSADWVSGEVRSYMKDQVATHVDTVQDVRDNDFEQTRFIYVRTKAAIYRLDLSSGAADDGDTVLQDNLGRRYVKVLELENVSFIELGQNLSGDRFCYIDLHASDGVDYSARIIRNPGINGNLLIHNTGSGGLLLDAIGGVFANSSPIVTDARAPGTVDVNNWYQKFPSGAIVQSISFVATTNAGGGVYCVYPIAFPNYGRLVSVTMYDALSRFAIYSPETTNSQAALMTDLGPSAGPYRFNALAVGY